MDLPNFLDSLEWFTPTNRIVAEAIKGRKKILVQKADVQKQESSIQEQADSNNDGKNDNEVNSTPFRKRHRRGDVLPIHSNENNIASFPSSSAYCILSKCECCFLENPDDMHSSIFFSTDRDNTGASSEFEIYIDAVNSKKDNNNNSVKDTRVIDDNHDADNHGDNRNNNQVFSLSNSSSATDIGENNNENNSNSADKVQPKEKVDKEKTSVPSEIQAPLYIPTAIPSSLDNEEVKICYFKINNQFYLIDHTRIQFISKKIVDSKVFFKINFPNVVVLIRSSDPNMIQQDANEKFGTCNFFLNKLLNHEKISVGENINVKNKDLLYYIHRYNKNNEYSTMTEINSKNNMKNGNDINKDKNNYLIHTLDEKQIKILSFMHNVFFRAIDEGWEYIKKNEVFLHPLPMTTEGVKSGLGSRTSSTSSNCSNKGHKMFLQNDKNLCVLLNDSIQHADRCRLFSDFIEVCHEELNQIEGQLLNGCVNIISDNNKNSAATHNNNDSNIKVKDVEMVSYLKSSLKKVRKIRSLMLYVMKKKVVIDYEN